MLILVDHNLAGKALVLWGALVAEGWSEFLSVRVVGLQDVGLALNSSDRIVWRFAQEHGMVLLTDNRNMKGPDSLEQTIREETTSTSLPVITIGDPDRLAEKMYRDQCVTRLAEILLDFENYHGTGRLFIP